MDIRKTRAHACKRPSPPPLSVLSDKSLGAHVGTVSWRQSVRLDATALHGASTVSNVSVPAFVREQPRGRYEYATPPSNPSPASTTHLHRDQCPRPQRAATIPSALRYLCCPLRPSTAASPGADPLPSPQRMDKPNHRVVPPAHFPDVDRCLLTDRAVISLSHPDAAGLLERRSNISGWYTYWFSLRGSQLLYFERTQCRRRGLLAGTISLFRHKLTLVNSLKRRREFEIADVAGKLHMLRAQSDAELHCWLQLFDRARNKIPPAQPILPLPALTARAAAAHPVAPPVQDQYSSFVDTHLEVDHVLCVVHGIGVSADILAANTSSLKESYAEVMARVFPDVDFRVEVLVIHWRESLQKLDVHKKLHAVVPIAPEPEDRNPLRQFMVHRIVDYVYYTHERYRRHILREVAAQLNLQIDNFRKRRPDFKGKISIMGHSLGAALCYDLMCRKVHDDQVLLSSEGMRLNFDAETLFCFGNPLGTFLGLDPTIGMGSDMLKLPFRILNVFKYHDPIATRLEPHIDMGMVDVVPVTVPCWFNMGLRESTAQWLSTWWPGGEKRKGSGSGSTSGEAGAMKYGNGVAESADAGVVAEGNGDLVSVDAERPGRVSQKSCSSEGVEYSGSWSSSGSGSENEGGEDVEVKDCGGSGRGSSGRGARRKRRSGSGSGLGERLDYALQASSAMEEVSTSWSALRAHTEYWGNRDAMLLMLSCMMKSSFGMRDGWEPADGGGLMVIDADILTRQERARGGDADAGPGDGSAGTSARSAMSEDRLEDVVEQVVDKAADDAVATFELMKVHPQLAILRGGGVSSKADGRADGGKAGGGWAAYLRSGWFSGGDAKAR